MRTLIGAILAFAAAWSAAPALAQDAPRHVVLVTIDGYRWPDLRANPASRSISVDVGLFLLAASAFMVIEARRLGVRFVWPYILFGVLLAISVTLLCL